MGQNFYNIGDAVFIIDLVLEILVVQQVLVLAGQGHQVMLQLFHIGG